MAGGTFPTTLPTYTVTAGAETANGAAGGTGLSGLLNQFETDITALSTKMGTGASTPTAGKVFRASGTGTSAWGQIVMATDLAAFSSADIAGVVSDETGTGALVFANTPTIVTPTIASFTNATHNHSNAAGGGNLSASAMTDRTRRVPLQLVADGTGGATGFIDNGYNVQFTTTPSAFGRGSCLVPMDYVSGTNMTLRIWAECSTTNSFAWQYYSSSHGIGDNMNTLPWNITAPATSGSVSYTANILQELAIVIPFTTIVAGNLFATAFKPNTNPTGTTNVRLAMLEYTADM